MSESCAVDIDLGSNPEDNARASRIVREVSLLALLGFIVACHPSTKAGSAAAVGAPSTAPPEASTSASASTAEPFDVSSETAFTQRARTLLLGEMPGTEVNATEPRTLVVKRAPAEEGAIVSLDRIWRDCANSPATCDNMLRHFIHVVAQTLTQGSVPAARLEQLMPALRPRAYVDEIRRSGRAEVLAEPFVGDIYVVYFVDSAERVRGVMNADLVALNLKASDLPAVTKRNLDDKLKQLRAPATPVRPNEVTILATGNFYESSRLLQSETWADFARGRKEMLLAAAPASDVLLFTLAPPADSGATFAKAVEIVFERAPKALSRTVLRWTDRGWQVHR
jgi:uncharacterized protein YtpQ (UPF0354 family)